MVSSPSLAIIIIMIIIISAYVYEFIRKLMFYGKGWQIFSVKIGVNIVVLLTIQSLLQLLKSSIVPQKVKDMATL